MSPQLNTIYNEDCLETMKRMPDNYLHAIVTDPPYGLSFLGKAWDYDVPKVEIWREALRVLKPGGHLLAFAGSRTYHRMAVAIEDAGFEIRDQLIWMYGSGFPKSLNIGKAVDKLQGNEREETDYIAPDGKKRWGGNSFSVGKEPDGRGINKATKGTSEWEGYGTALKPSHEDMVVAQKPLNTVPLESIIRSILCQLSSLAPTVPKSSQLSQLGINEGLNTAQWIADENTSISDALSGLTVMLQLELEKNTNLNTVLSWLNILAEVLQVQNTYTTLTETSLTIDLRTLLSLEWENILKSITLPKSNLNAGQIASAYSVDSLFKGVQLKLNDIRTHFAQDGAMSRAGELNSSVSHEPCVLARKPIEGTVANNVLKHGTGGLNIDGCRVGYQSEQEKEKHSQEWNRKWDNDWLKQRDAQEPNYPGWKPREENGRELLGRFPANLIHDGSDEVEAVFPQTGGGKMTIGGTPRKTDGFIATGSPDRSEALMNYGDSGSASRYFYTAKASKRERGAGNNHPTVKPLALMKYLVKLVAPPKNGIIYDPFSGSGTTLLACQKLGIDFIGSEISKEYCDISEERLRHFGGDKREE